MNLATLIHVLPAIEAAFAARLTGWTFEVRARFIAENSGGNRIVLVPTDESFEPGRQQSGVRRVTRVRVVHVAAYIWGVPTKADGSIYKRGEAIPLDGNRVPTDGRYSVGQVEAGLNALACALEDVAKACQYELESGVWLDQEGSSVSDYGVAYLLTFSLRIPIVYGEYAHPPAAPLPVGRFVDQEGNVVQPTP